MASLPVEQESSIFTLPPEIRNRIYELALECERDRVWQRRLLSEYIYRPKVPFLANSDSRPPALAAVCRQVRAEATPLFFGTFTFEFDGYPTHGTCTIFRQIRGSAAENIRKVVWLRGHPVRSAYLNRRLIRNLHSTTEGNWAYGYMLVRDDHPVHIEASVGRDRRIQIDVLMQPAAYKIAPNGESELPGEIHEAGICCCTLIQMLEDDEEKIKAPRTLIGVLCEYEALLDEYASATRSCEWLCLRDLERLHEAGESEVPGAKICWECRRIKSI